MGGGFLECVEIDSVWLPINQASTLIKILRYRSWCSPLSRNHCQLSISGEGRHAPHRRSKNDLFAVRRPTWSIVGSRLRNDFAHRVVSQIQHVDVGGYTLNQIGINRRAERYL